MKPEKKVLFILKERLTSHSNFTTISSGLFNSAHFVVDMLNKNGIETHLVEVKDNNCIDREVKKHNPTHVVIEAL
jgi:CRISPR/Cas system CSM-associated protein Csm3 (group 7 of RAMP superfamily)